MKMKSLAYMMAVLHVAVMLAVVPAMARQITGVPGSPSATTTIDGKQLPPQPEKAFGGKIERNVIDSTPYWPPLPSSQPPQQRLQPQASPCHWELWFQPFPEAAPQHRSAVWSITTVAATSIAPCFRATSWCM